MLNFHQDGIPRKVVENLDIDYASDRSDLEKLESKVSGQME